MHPEQTSNKELMVTRACGLCKKYSVHSKREGTDGSLVDSCKLDNRTITQHDQICDQFEPPPVIDLQKCIAWVEEHRTKGKFCWKCSYYSIGEFCSLGKPLKVCRRFDLLSGMEV